MILSMYTSHALYINKKLQWREILPLVHLYCMVATRYVRI